MAPRASQQAAALACASHVRASLASLKRDVALSFRICGRDFGVLGRELVAALAATQQRERAAARALDHERSARRRAQTKVAELQGPVRVLCRVRPLLHHEDDGEEPGDKPSAAVRVASQQDIHVRVPSSATAALASGASSSSTELATKSFSFERVLGEDVTQQQLYKEIQPLVVSAVDGQHACVFAYGQTGSGKTTTIHGTENDRGLVFRAAETIFELVREQQHVFDFNVTVQMVEIYNEEMYDLLGPEENSSSPGSAKGSYTMIMPFQTNSSNSHSPTFVSRRPHGEIRHSERGVYLRNVESVAVHSASDVISVIQSGEGNRTVHSSGEDDEHSSRSHCVIMIDVQRCSHVDGQIDGGRFALIDLAGSERLLRAETTGSGKRIREAQHINKSLAAIGDVLAALLAKDKHVPYRNTKLTHLLQESLSAADAQTLMLVHVSPAAADVSETVNSLKFASRVNKLHNTSKRRSERQETSRLHGMISSQAAQLQALQEKLSAELELRRKYEKRLEEYRQEDHRRRAKEEDRGRSTPYKQSLPQPQGPSTPSKTSVPNHQSSTISSSRGQGTPEQPFSTRRWSLYSRKDPLKSSNGSRQASAGGQENISENIIRSRSPLQTLPSVPEKSTITMATPVRRARRLSVMMHSDRKAVRSPLRVSTQVGSKRKTETPSHVRSILKKQRLSLEPTQMGPPTDMASSTGASKQVSFDLSSRTATRVGGVQLLPPSTHSNASGSAALPPRQPTSTLRTPISAGRVPGPAARVVARPYTHSGIASSPVTRVIRSVRSPSLNKPKWNASGWR